MKYKNEAERFSIAVAPDRLARVQASRAAWFETQEEVEKGLEWGKRKAELIRWTRRQMGRKLTQRERRCIELYYFRAMTLEEVGREIGKSASTACRTIQQSIKKLRNAAEEDPSWRPRK